MEIKLNTNVDSIGRLQNSQSKKNDAKVENADVGFQRSEALNQSLQQSPDVRAELVAKGKQAAALSTYPPPETIKKISALLAMHINEAE